MWLKHSPTNVHWNPQHCIRIPWRSDVFFPGAIQAHVRFWYVRNVTTAAAIQFSIIIHRLSTRKVQIQQEFERISVPSERDPAIQESPSRSSFLFVTTHNSRFLLAAFHCRNSSWFLVFLSVFSLSTSPIKMQWGFCRVPLFSPDRKVAFLHTAEADGRRSGASLFFSHAKAEFLHKTAAIKRYELQFLRSMMSWCSLLQGLQSRMVRVSCPWEMHPWEQLFLCTFPWRAATTARSAQDEALQRLSWWPMQQRQLLLCPWPTGTPGFPGKEGPLPTLQRRYNMNP